MVALTASIKGTPKTGVSAWGMEEAPPANWSVSNISDGGAWDATNKKIKWFFLNDQPITTTYQATPPSGEKGTKTFSGIANFDGTGVSITGDTTIVPGGDHPSDLDDNWRLTISESINYATAWKKGQTWPRNPNPIPMSYAINSLVIWKTGEEYCYVAGDEPNCWKAKSSGACTTPTVEASPSSSVKKSKRRAASPAMRTLPAGYSPETELVVTIQVTPPTNTSVWGVEETPPPNWVVDSISDSGEWDAINKKVKWFFLDDQKKTLTYKLMPPTGETGTKTFTGIANFDGTESTVGGGATLGLLVLFTVTPESGPHGTITPNTPQEVMQGNTTAFTVQAESGYHVASVTGCGGALAGTTYTTGPVNANCTVKAIFSNTYALTVDKSGSGTGTVTSSPKGIVCGTTCQYGFKPGTKVTLTAKADGTAIFTGWTGACSGTTSCKVTMSADVNVGATFVSESHLTVSPISKDYGKVKINKTKSATFTLKNTGKKNVNIASLAFAGTNADQFAKSADKCSGTTLAANKTCTAAVVFAPKSAGAESATLNIVSDDTSHPGIDVPLTGAGSLTATADDSETEEQNRE